MKQAVQEHQNDSAPLNSIKIESEVIEEVKSEYDIYKENSFWIYHIGPEITLTILAILLWVSFFTISRVILILIDKFPGHYTDQFMEN